jgi:hypothetical protein
MVRAFAAHRRLSGIEASHVFAFPINRSMESAAVRAGQPIARAVGY